MPPLLTHLSLVLHNWHRLDPSGPLLAENLACNCQFLGGQDETWFYTVTVEIEARGGGVFGALLQVTRCETTGHIACIAVDTLPCYDVG